MFSFIEEGAGSDMKTKKILIVDDEAGIVKMLRTVLHKEGYSLVDSAYTGQEAIEKTKHKETCIG